MRLTSLCRRITTALAAAEQQTVRMRRRACRCHPPCRNGSCFSATGPQQRPAARAPQPYSAAKSKVLNTPFFLTPLSCQPLPCRCSEYDAPYPAHHLLFTALFPLLSSECSRQWQPLPEACVEYRSCPNMTSPLLHFQGHNGVYRSPPAGSFREAAANRCRQAGQASGMLRSSTAAGIPWAWGTAKSPTTGPATRV